jgi:hypothetical protein
MAADNQTFASFEELKKHIDERGYVVVGYWNVPEYDGMVLFIDIRKEKNASTYVLNLEWQCLGLDFYGDTLQESYMYRFENLFKLMPYLFSKFGIALTHVPVKFSFDHTQYPNVLRNEDKKTEYEAAWARFQKDFKAGMFLDNSLELIWYSMEQEN